jgi:heme/copper-type cytochrome/quinol oxidase subunit 2
VGTLVEITIAGGQVAGGLKHVQVGVGQPVTIRITSDVAEELHVHGYDLKRELTPGAPVELTFTADIPGVFEIELEHSGLKVAELQVG